MSYTSYNTLEINEKCKSYLKGFNANFHMKTKILFLHILKNSKGNVTMCRHADSTKNMENTDKCIKAT